MAYVQENNPIAKTLCGRRRAGGVASGFKKIKRTKISGPCKAAAKRKFKDLSPSSLASWLIKTRKGNLSKIISSLNQQYVFNRQKKPSYARKMKTVMNIVRKRLGL